MTSIETGFINLWKENVAKNNNYVIKSIEHVLRRGLFSLVNGKLVRFSSTSTIYTLLNNLIHEINHYTSLFVRNNVVFTQLEHFRKYTYLFHAISIFNGIIFNSCAKHLFINYTDTKPAFPTSFGLFLDEIYKYQHGCDDDGDSENVVVDFDISNCDYIDIDSDNEEEHEPRINTQHEIHKQLRLLHPDKSLNELCVINDNINCLLCNYFNFIGESTYHSEFVSYILELYDSNNLHVPFLEFEKKYNAWKEKHTDKSSEAYIWEKTFYPSDIDISYMVDELLLPNHTNKTNIDTKSTFFHKTVKVGGGSGNNSLARKTRKKR